MISMFIILRSGEITANHFVFIIAEAFVLSLLLAAAYKDGRCARLEKLGFCRRPSSDISRHISLGLMTTSNEY